MTLWNETEENVYRRVRVYTIAGLVAVAILLAGAARLGAVSPEPEPDAVAPPPPLETMELPREWRWERKAIRFDHMFRQLR